MKKSFDTPVLLIFFNRPDTFKKVFDEVRKAKPKFLILAQDGPRNENDIPGHAACREIAESVDWDCEIIRDYSEKNLGCGMRPQTAITNALKTFDRVIVLEDDCIPSQSFFGYCEELLEKYKDDERICYISGLNHFEEWDCGNSDYFFAKNGAIWGWATWRRAWSKYYDYAISGVRDKRIANLAKRQVDNKHMAVARYNAWIETNKLVNNNEKISYWDAQWGFVKFAQNMLTIVPKKNLIHNIGVGATSTHAQNLSQVGYVKYKNFVFIPTYELEFPLKHPDYCVCDAEYDDLVCKCALGNPVRRFVVKGIKKFFKLK